MVQSVVETDISQSVTHLTIHTKLPAFKTVIAMTLSWNQALFLSTQATILIDPVSGVSFVCTFYSLPSLWYKACMYLYVDTGPCLNHSAFHMDLLTAWPIDMQICIVGEGQ